MTAAPVCQQCGNALSGDAPQGVCPECLFKLALASQSAADPEATNLYSACSEKAIAPEAGVRIRYFGDYELLEEVARGGMGIVWKARQSRLNRQVALKTIRAGALASPDEVKRFLREAEAAASLQHPNIVAIHEVGEYGGQHYFSMDYVAGRDLAALVKDGPLPPHRAAQYVRTIAEAIQFAHQRGTLHRDLKPQNVLIDEADQPRITDFGLAKLMNDDSRLTQSGVVMGSPSYMPPEQACGRQAEIGPASDVYALGAILYELLTGRPPFRGDTALATMRAVLEAEPEAPRRVRADIPPDLETICLKCLEKAPLARYATARALADELDRFLKGEPIQARPASAVRKVVSWARRHPGVLAALAALVMVSLGFGLFYLLEENAFLRAAQADPNLARVPGSRHDALEIGSGISAFGSVIGIYLLTFLTMRARGLSFTQAFDPTSHFRPIQHLGIRTRKIAIGAGLVLVVWGVTLLVFTIQARVWEGESVFGPVLTSYALTYFGLAALAIAIRDFRLEHYGMPAMPARQLTEGEIEPIRSALADHDWSLAIKHYRATVPGSTVADARQYVIRLYYSLRTANPDKYRIPPLSLAALNWCVMLICILIEATIVGVAWAVLSPAQPGAFALRFAYAYLFGMGSAAGMRVKGLWKRLLLLVPSLALMACVEWFLSREAERSSIMAAWFLGFLCGVALMISGFAPRRKGTTLG